MPSMCHRDDRLPARGGGHLTHHEDDLTAELKRAKCRRGVFRTPIVSARGWCGFHSRRSLSAKAIANVSVNRLPHHAHVVLTAGNSVRLSQATDRTSCSLPIASFNRSAAEKRRKQHG